MFKKACRIKNYLDHSHYEFVFLNLLLYSFEAAEHLIF